MGPDTGEYRVARGAGWGDYYPGSVRASNRFCDAPTYRINDLGFRGVLVPRLQGL
jgi:formylglycine-generating enzyme required for sulfatase activity